MGGYSKRVSQRPLQRDALARTLADLTLAIQRVRKVQEAISIAAAGVETQGLDVAIIAAGQRGYELLFLSARLGELEEGAKRLLERWKRASGDAVPALRSDGVPRFLGAFPEVVAAWRPGGGAADAAVLAVAPGLVRRRAIVAPLSLNEDTWGAVVFMHDELTESDLPLLSLFALQLGSVLGVISGNERLDRRTAELEFVHRLALSPIRRDVGELSHEALESICRSSNADAGTLHRFEVSSEQYELVGNAHGYDGALIEAYRTFRLPQGALGEVPLVSRVADIREGSVAVAAAGFQYAAFIPLVIEARPVGLLCLFRKTELAFSEAEVRSAEILGLQVASLLERHRLYHEAQRLYADLKASYDELARAQAEVVRHERLAALGELAAVMAHEVRNPLGVIFNSLTTLKRVMKPTGDTEMLLNMVGEEADRLNRIVADLLDFARPYELVKKPIALEPFILGAMDAAAKSLPPSVPIKLASRFDRELPPFPVDAHLLRQALINLIMNAAQSMPRGGSVTVSAHVERRGTVPWLVLEVHDEGLGLTPRATERLFQPFFTTKATGTGLGLAVVKRIVDSHGGEVVARPNGEKGTTFEVRLPGGIDREGVTPPRPSPSVPRRES